MNVARMVLLGGAFMAFVSCASPFPCLGAGADDNPSLLTTKAFREYSPFLDPIDPAAFEPRRFEVAVFFVANETRERCGLQALSYHPLLEKAAQDFARRMVEGDFYAHEDAANPVGRIPEQRLANVGALNPKPAENLATSLVLACEPGEKLFPLDEAGLIFSRSPDGPPLPMRTYLGLADVLVKQWLDSPPHRENLLSKDALQMGCGTAFFRDEKGFPKLKTVQLIQCFEPLKTK